MKHLTPKMNNTKIKNNALVVFLISISLLATTDVRGDEENKSPFIIESNAIFVEKLNLYRRLLVREKENRDLENKIEDLIKIEIKTIEDWTGDYYKQTVLPDDVADISLLAAGEHSAKIKSRLDDMRLVIIGFHEELGDSSSLINKIDVLRKLIDELNQFIKDKS